MLSVIIPVFNEENAIAATLNDVVSVLGKSVEYEIIVVDDGSTDGTAEVLQKQHSGNLNPVLRIIRHPENAGYGKAIYDGMLQAKYNNIAILDADGTYPVSELPELLKYLPEYDMVVGMRSGPEYKKGFIKRPARIFFHYLAEYATGSKIPDVNSGFRIFKKDLVMKYREYLCTGFSFTTTITLFFFLNHYYVKYLPISYYKRAGRSKVKNFRDTLRALQIITETILLHGPIKLFILFANISLVSGLVLALVNRLFFHFLLFKIVSALLIAAYLPIFCLGLLAYLLKRINDTLKNRNQ